MRQEWHAPDRMYLNARHVLIVEPAGTSSKVAQLIADSKQNKRRFPCDDRITVVDRIRVDYGHFYWLISRCLINAVTGEVLFSAKSIVR